MINTMLLKHQNSNEIYKRLKHMSERKEKKTFVVSFLEIFYFQQYSPPQIYINILSKYIFFY